MTFDYDFQTPPPDESCATCQHFLDYRETESDWANGYCAHPDHSDPARSEHHEYGGHWTNDAAWCGWHTAKYEAVCDCIASGNESKPKQHGADPHAKNCAVYTNRNHIPTRPGRSS